MPNRHYRYVPKVIDVIRNRPFTFEFPDDLDPNWATPHRVRSHLFNGISLTMPYLEPWMIDTMRDADEHITDPRLKADMRAFNGQEANHAKCHRRLNKLLQKNGHPEFANVEEKLSKSFEKLRRRSLRTRLAYSAGFECMTNGFTRWLIHKRHCLFNGANAVMTSFWLMHMIEETEHKTVAFDAYMAYSGAYLPRAFGVFHGSFHILGYSVFGMLAALKREGFLYTRRGLYEGVKEMASLIWNVGPFLLRALLPWHNPRIETDPEWMSEWVAGYARLPKGAPIPLVDTNDPNMPVPFPSYETAEGNPPAERKEGKARTI